MVCFSSSTNSPWYLTTIRSWLVIVRDPCTKNLNVWSPLLPLLVVPSLDYSPSLQTSQVLSAVALVFLWPLRSFTIIYSCKLFFYFSSRLGDRQVFFFHPFLFIYLTCLVEYAKQEGRTQSKQAHTTRRCRWGGGK